MRRDRFVVYLSEQEAEFVQKIRTESGSSSDSDAIRFMVKTMKMITEGQAYIFPAAPGVKTMVSGRYRLEKGRNGAK